MLNHFNQDVVNNVQKEFREQRETFTGEINALTSENTKLKAQIEIFKTVVEAYEDRVIRRDIANLLMGKEGEETI